MQFFDDEDFSWRILAVEAVVIMLSVLLGFTLNGWRQSAGEQATVEAALTSIAAEMHYNEGQVDKLLPHYRTMSDTLRHLAATKGKDTPIELSELPGSRGMRIPLLRASAFETARSTGALSHMEFGLANKLSSAYRLQGFYTDLIKKLTNGLLEDTFKTIGDWLRVYILLANNGGFAKATYPKLLTLLSQKHSIVIPDTTRSAFPRADSTRAAR